ncbi:MAG: Hsp70 family protein, partial [Thermoguttaceae bacterium]|nr:Hsp70 family protein [Thermoguttaceae bacterium]
MARDYGAEMSESYVSSAKSWLCHNGVDRTAAILPWTPDLEMEKQSGGNLSSEKKGENADRTNESAGMDYKSGLTETKSPKTFNEPVRRAKKWSPVEVSAAYLFHLRMAWNNSHPDYPLEKQDIVLTLPASFDEVARELTIEAAKLAGLPRITLIEEPQAAFYSWIDAHRENWSDLVLAGQKILVCDVGGGTTDLTLIRVLPVADKENSEESAGGPAVEGKPAV